MTDVRQKNKNFSEDSDQERITRFSNNQLADLSRNFDRHSFKLDEAIDFFKIQSMPFIPKNEGKVLVSNYFEIIDTGLLCVLC